jgi:Tol biopolymer transport system component
MMFLLAAIGVATADPAPDLKGHRFLVTSVRTGDTEVFVVLELFTVDVDGGTAPRQLTRLGGVSTPAAWSPDGSRSGTPTR